MRTVTALHFWLATDARSPLVGTSWSIAFFAGLRVLPTLRKHIIPASKQTLGEESSPGAGTASWHEDHVSADVALAFVQYVHATGDERFLREQAWPVLDGVADWIASRVTRTDGTFELRHSMGIAERKSASRLMQNPSE